jgi:hypothetical protein
VAIGMNRHGASRRRTVVHRFALSAGYLLIAYGVVVAMLSNSASEQIAATLTAIFGLHIVWYRRWVNER